MAGKRMGTETRERMGTAIQEGSFTLLVGSLTAGLPLPPTRHATTLCSAVGRRRVSSVALMKGGGRRWVVGTGLLCHAKPYDWEPSPALNACNSGMARSDKALTFQLKRGGWQVPVNFFLNEMNRQDI